MKFPHLKGREELLKPLGFTRQQAEWITLVCLHSGLFTRDQVEAFFGYAKSSANRFIQALLRTRISHKPIASETITDGRRICRIFGKQIYRELEIPHIRHRRETSLEVTRRRLLSLDFVLDHPELAWLPTEQDKVACFQQLESRARPAALQDLRRPGQGAGPLFPPQDAGCHGAGGGPVRLHRPRHGNPQ